MHDGHVVEMSRSVVGGVVVAAADVAVMTLPVAIVPHWWSVLPSHVAVAR